MDQTCPVCNKQFTLSSEPFALSDAEIAFDYKILTAEDVVQSEENLRLSDNIPTGYITGCLPRPYVGQRVMSINIKVRCESCRFSPKNAVL